MMRFGRAWFTSYVLMLLSIQLVGCASGEVDVLDAEGRVIGQCSAEFNFHRYGAQDSVDYILHLCAQEHVEQGRLIADQRYIEQDFSLPTPPKNRQWNQSLAHQAFVDKQITEQQLGYVLAAIEYHYWMQRQQAQALLEQGQLTTAQFEQRLAQAKRELTGE
ncbi:hypothetical protein [Shewanella waksmanii]|uniref:hypothetical protein n=1 Tax=Shewanella waksmanii TaxID=213783 RepID=UPI0012F963CF|nr:hypothetical protein [Shewanella waksmanii]